MNFYYDVLLNFCDEEIYEFYEWEKKDPLDVARKIPIVKVTNQLIVDILKYHIKFNKDILNLVKDKTILGKKSSSKSLKYACILTDSKNALAIELNDDGQVLFVSRLLLEDENNINEISFAIKKVDLKYEKISKRKITNELRQVNNIKKIIKLELENLVKEHNFSKLSYLYIEWFDKEETSYKNMLKEMLTDLNLNIATKHLKIYEIIKSSYNKI